MFQVIICPSSVAQGCDYSLWYKAPTVLYTASCKHTLVLLGMGEIIAQSMLS